MIDLVSTNASASPQTVRCAQLLASVIAQATRDLSQRPSKQEYQERRNRSRDAISCLRFFSEPKGAFRSYCQLIGINADRYVECLKAERPDEEVITPINPLFSQEQFRACRARFAWWDNATEADKQAAEGENDATEH